MIRPAASEDYVIITNLWLETSLQAHHFISASYWQEALPLVKNEYLPAAQNYIFEDKRQIKGFISLMPGNYIGALFVKKEFQKHGIGSKLLEYVRRHKPNLNLKVFSKNKQALRFYQRSGFKIVATDFNDDTGEEELLMAWAKGCKNSCKTAS